MTMPYYPGLPPCALSSVTSPSTPDKFTMKYIPGKGTYRISTGCLAGTVPPVSGYLTFDGYLRTQFPTVGSSFTIEFFANVAESTSFNPFFEINGAQYLEMYVQEGELRLWMVPGSFISLTFPDSLLHSWHHYAICVESGNATVYVDGISVSESFPLSSFTGDITIGYGDGEEFNGQLTNFRISTKALYPGEVPSIPLSDKSSVLLLLAYPNGPTDDSSPLGIELEKVGTVTFHYGPIDVSPPIFSDYGILNFDGNAYLGMGPNPSLSIGTSDFTLDWYMNPTSSDDRSVLSWLGPVGVLECAIVQSKLVVIFGNYTSGPPPLYGYPGVECPVFLNTWHHYTIYRRSAEIRVLIDGIKVGSFSIEPTQVSGNSLYIGNGDSPRFIGSMTNIRLKTGIHGNTLPLTGGILLFLGNPYHPFDNTGTAVVVTNYGVTNTLGPIDMPLSRRYNVFTEFSEVNTLTDTLNPGTIDFTVECFFRYIQDGCIWAFYSGTPNLQVYVIDGRVDFSFLGTTATIGIVDFDTWYYCALTRYRDNWYGTLNGYTKYLATGSLNLGNSKLAIGNAFPGSGDYLVGAISNFHYVKRALYYIDSIVDLIPARPIRALADTELLLLGVVRGISGTCAVIPGPFTFSQFTDYGILTGFYGTNTITYGVNPGVSDFTVECFFNCDQGGALWMFGSVDSMYLGIDVVGGILYLASPLIAGPIGQVNSNQWYFCAVTRRGNNWFVTLNGTTAPFASERLDLRGKSLSIGNSPGSENPFDGFISNLRFTSRAIYSTSDYLIPGIPLSAIPNTEILLLAKPGSPLTDSSGNNRPVIGRCNSVSGPFTPPSQLSANYNLLTGFSVESFLYYPTLYPLQNCTVECFFYETSFTNSPSQTLWIFSDGYGINERYIQIYLYNGTLRFAGNGIFYSTEIVLDAWYHCAVTRVGDNFYVGINGAIVYTAVAQIDLSSSYLSIGNNNSDILFPFRGFISNFRYTNQSLYTEDYVIPTPTLPVSVNTELLLLAKPGLALIDSSNTPKTATGFCSSATGPMFPPETRYGIFVFSDSQYLAYTINPGTSNFTVEFFFKTSESLTPLWSFGNDTRLVGNYVRDFNLYLEASNGISQIIGTVTPNTWYYYALTRSGNNWYTTVNDTTVLSASGSLDLEGSTLFVGFFTGYRFLQGSITNFRYVKRALYTTTSVIPDLPLEPILDTELLLLARPGHIFEDSSAQPKTLSGQCSWGPGPI